MQYFTDENWALKKKWYEEKIGAIIIPKSIDNKVIQNLVSLIDEVINSAFFDLSMVEYDYNMAFTQYQTRLSKAFLSAKNARDTKEGAPRGGAISDEKAKKIAQLETEKDGSSVRKLEMEARKTFMHNVVTLLQEKRSLLTISYGLSKIESTV